VHFDGEVLVEDIFTVAEIDIPEREPVIDPWLKTGHLGMVFAKRGVGKTYFTLSVALSAAVGQNLMGGTGWTVPKPRPTLYIDGEMDLADLRMRAAGILAGAHAFIQPGQFYILSRDRMMSLGKRLPYLSEGETRRAVLDAIPEGVELVVLDNLSCLVGGEENEAKGWDLMQEFLLELRFRGIAVLMVHHAGKGGDQRGTSRREDVLDVSIKLESTHDGDEDDPGGAFRMLWSKRRGFSAAEASPFEAHLEVDKATGVVTWTLAPVTNTTDQRVLTEALELMGRAEKVTQRKIAENTGLSLGAVNKAMRRLREVGLLP
jgi:hypothetical protein